MKKQVFLGGSCNPTTWRADIAIPILQEADVAFYNPQIDDWSEQDAQYKAAGIKGGITEVEALAKEESQMLLFVIDSQTRAIASILEATENIVRNRPVVLVVDDIKDGEVINGQIITGGELKDLNRARSYLRDVANRNHLNAVMASTVSMAVKFICDHLK